MKIEWDEKNTLERWILGAANGEAIVAVVIGEGYSEERPGPKNKVISWEEALPYLRYEFDSGYGSAGCTPVYAWTKSKTIFVSQYDGSTTPCWVPRDPIDCSPVMPGGG